MRQPSQLSFQTLSCRLLYRSQPPTPVKFDAYIAPLSSCQARMPLCRNAPCLLQSCWYDTQVTLGRFMCLKKRPFSPKAHLSFLVGGSEYVLAPYYPPLSRSLRGALCHHRPEPASISSPVVLSGSSSGGIRTLSSSAPVTVREGSRSSPICATFLLTHILTRDEPRLRECSPPPLRAHFSDLQ